MGRKSLGIGFEITAKDRATPVMARVGRSSRSLRFEFEQGVREAAAFTTRIGTLTLALGALATFGIAKAVKAFGDVQDNMITIQRFSKLTDDRIQALQKSFINIAADLPLSAKELSNVGIIIARLGITAPKDIERIALQSAQLARVSDLTEESAAAAFTRITQLMGLTFDQTNNVGSAMVELSGITLATVGDITQVAVRFAALGRQFGLSADQVLAFSAVTKNAGVESQVAGTSMSKILKQMADRTSAFANVMRISEPDFRALFDKEPATALKKFFEAFGGLNKFKITDNLRRLGLANERVVRTVVGFSAVTGKLEQALQRSAKAFEKGTRLQKAFEKANTSLNNRIRTLVGQFNTLNIQIGEGIALFLTPLLNIFIAINAVLLKLPKPLFILIGIIGSLIATGLVLAGVFLTIVGLTAAAQFGLAKLAGAFGLTAANANIFTLSLRAADLSILFFKENLKTIPAVLTAFSTAMTTQLKRFGKSFRKIFRRLTRNPELQMTRFLKRTGKGIARFTRRGLKSLNRFRKNAIPMLVAVINGFGALSKAVLISMRVMLKAMVTNPVGLVILGIGLAVASVVISLKALKKAFQTNFGGFRDIAGKDVEKMKKSFGELRKSLSTLQDSLVKIFRAMGFDIDKLSDLAKPFLKLLFGGIRRIVVQITAMADGLKGLVDGFNTLVQSEGFSKFVTLIESLLELSRTGIAGAVAKFTGTSVTEALGGTRKALGSIKPEETVPISRFNVAALGNLLGGAPGLQAGGIVTKPTFARLAEGSKPEVVLPLSDLAKMLAVQRIQNETQMAAPAQQGNAVAPNLTIPITLELDGTILAEIVREIKSEDVMRFFNAKETEERGVV